MPNQTSIHGIDVCQNLLHTMAAHPPARRNAPEKAHVRLVNMSFGVMRL